MILRRHIAVRATWAILTALVGVVTIYLAVDYVDNSGSYTGPGAGASASRACAPSISATPTSPVSAQTATFLNCEPQFPGSCHLLVREQATSSTPPMIAPRGSPEAHRRGMTQIRSSNRGLSWRG